MSSGLGVLTSGSKTPVVSQTTVSTNLLKPLQILTDLVVQDVSHHLVGLTILVIPLPIKEPVGYLVLPGVLHKKLVRNINGANILLA